MENSDRRIFCTVMILCFRTDSSGQTVQTQIRLLLEKQSDQRVHCLQFCLHFQLTGAEGSLVSFQDRQASIVRMCVCQHFQTSSPLKPLGWLKPKFIRSLLGTGERKFIQMILVTWPRWLPCPYMVKTLKSLLLRNQKADDIEILYAT